jgi:alkanesulfonate monooxygenase SsuD/methylene tetrahydromethanopterin reductase-like flavin-dependent oxidoreductase (luciferase family)
MIGGLIAKELRAWTQGAEEHRFSTLAVLDRLVCDGSEPLVALAAAAAVTDRIRLATQVLIPGYQGNTALLAKQAATIHQLSEGRLVLGVAAGIRPDDYEVSGADFHRRGRELDRQLEELASIWNDSVIGSRAGARPGPRRVGMRSALGWLHGRLRSRPNRAGRSDGGVSDGQTVCPSSTAAPASPIRPAFGIRAVSRAPARATAANTHRALR